MRKEMSPEDTAVYIQMLELLCENQQLLCEANAEYICSLKEDIENQEQAIFRLRRIQELQAEQLKMTKDLVIIYEENAGRRIMKWLKSFLSPPVPRL